jgi:hypothetical protein
LTAEKNESKAEASTGIVETPVAAEAIVFITTISSVSLRSSVRGKMSRLKFRSARLCDSMSALSVRKVVSNVKSVMESGDASRPGLILSAVARRVTSR